MQKYKTAITTHRDEKVYVRGKNLIDLASDVSFAAAIYLTLKGELPGPEAEKLFSSMLTISIDHGVNPSSVVAARNIYSAGSPVQAAVAGGVLAFGEYHGGAIEAAMENFYEFVGKEAGGVIDDFKSQDKRLAGFGHKLYKADDPRTVKLIEVAKETGYDGEYLKFAQSIATEFKARDKSLPLNIDGIIAALLCEMGFDAKVGKGIFIIARVPGLVAHVVEEATREKPVRRLEEDEVEYDGPSPED
ncbi:citryl-CoA lyase [Candidatus Curtissbacteria bacterium]|nr:citryl-CoA lyase [Candidatus Curtissbacteria bacterium]